MSLLKQLWALEEFRQLVFGISLYLIFIANLMWNPLLRKKKYRKKCMFSRAE